MTSPKRICTHSFPDNHSFHNMSNEKVSELIEEAHCFIKHNNIEYKCDTCTAILTEKRWKCRSCPAFDECETCHEDKLLNHGIDMKCKDCTVHDMVLMEFSPLKNRWFTRCGLEEERKKRGRPRSTPSKEVTPPNDFERELENKNQHIVLLQYRIKKLRNHIESLEEDKRNDTRDNEIRDLRAENKRLRDQLKPLKHRVAIVQGFSLVRIETNSSDDAVNPI